MKARPGSEDQFTMYLLGELPEDQQAMIEEVLLTDDGYYEQLLIAEDELRCDYVAGLLDTERREAFEKRFAVSLDDHSRLAFAAALVYTVSPRAVEDSQAALEFTEAPPNVIDAPPPPINASRRLTGLMRIIARFTVWAWGLLASLGRRLRARHPLTRLAKLIPRVKLERVEQPEPVTNEASAGVLERIVRIAFAVLAIILIAGVALIIAQTIRYQLQVRELEGELGRQKGLLAHAEEEKRRSSELALDLEVERSHRLMLEEDAARHDKQAGPKVEATPTTASFILSPSPNRNSGEVKKPLIQPGESERVRLQLNLKRPDTYQSYEALLKSSQGRPVWGQAGLRPSRLGPIQVIALSLLARVVPPGDYYVELRGLTSGGLAEPVDDYYFSVAQR
jgi:hypothetical protein